MPDSRTQHRQVLEEMPIDGKSVSRGEQSWTIRVDYAFLEANSSNRILKLRLEGEPVLKRTLIVAGELLITYGRGNSDWLVEKIERHLALTPELREENTLELTWNNDQDKESR